MEKISSPCNGICVIDEDTGLCVGCLRTSDEIANWSSYSPEKRDEILEDITLREERQTQ